MKTLSKLGLILFTLAIILIFTPDKANGDDRRFLRGAPGEFSRPPFPILPSQQDLRASGYFYFCYIHTGGRDIRPELTTTLTGIWAFKGLVSIEDCTQTFSVKIYADNSSVHTYGDGRRPGCGFGNIGCLYTYGINADMSINTEAMLTWPRAEDIEAVLYHELFHAMMDAGEQYQHVNSINCLPRTDTVMSCGIGSRRNPGPFDSDTWNIFFYPQAPNEYGLGYNGLTYVFWRNFIGDLKTTRIAILYSDDGLNWYWSGIYVSPSPTVYQGWHVQESPGRCYAIKFENAISWFRHYNEVLAGCL